MLKCLPRFAWTPIQDSRRQGLPLLVHSAADCFISARRLQPYHRSLTSLSQPRRRISEHQKGVKRAVKASADTVVRPPSPDGDEPEAAVLLIACAIGLVTGGGVVVFNNVIHSIRHLAFQETPVEATHWGRWARQLPLPAEFGVLVAPPLVGGVVVGTLRAVTQFDKPITSSSAAASSPLKKGAPKDGSGSTASGGDHAEAGLPAIPAGKQHRPGRQQSREPFWGKARQAQLRRAAAPALRALAAAITLGSGASLGPEGPSVDIGRSSARALGSLLRSKHRRLFPLIAAGSGAGVAAGFNAPISGVFFAVESVLQRPGAKDDLGVTMDSSVTANSSGLTIAMVLLASVVAAVVSQAGLGASPAFRVPEYQLQSTFELPLVLVLGALCGAVAAAFKVSSQVSDRAFTGLQESAASRRLSQPAQDILWPTLGGLGTGLIALAYPEVLYQGFGNVNAILEARGSDYAPAVLLQIVAAKVVTTCLCQRSGLVGGIYAPSIFMGAALGSAFGGIASVVCTPLGLDVTAPQAYALVGVAGMLAALCQLPLTAVLLLFELTHDYFIIIPTLASVGISYWVASFPLASVLQPLSPLSRLLPSAPSSASISASQARSFMTEEISTAVVDAVTDVTPLGRDQGLLESTAQQFIDKDTRPPSVAAAEALRPPGTMQEGGRVQQNGLLQGSGESGLFGHQGRGLSASVSFSSFRPRGSALSPSRLNDAASASAASANGAEIKAEGASNKQMVGGLPLGRKAQEMDNLSVLCALRQSCVMLTPDTPLTEALEVMDEAEETVALVLDADGALIGVLTKASVVEAIAASKTASATSISQ